MRHGRVAHPFLLQQKFRREVSCAIRSKPKLAMARNYNADPLRDLNRHTLAISDSSEPKFAGSTLPEY